MSKRPGLTVERDLSGGRIKSIGACIMIEAVGIAGFALLLYLIWR